MSHFCCLVITPNKPTDEELTAILQPWHEFESTGIRDQYVVEVDITDEVLEEFNKPQEIVVLNPTSDTWVSFPRYDDIFYTKESEKKEPWGMNRKEFELPAGAEIKTVTADEGRKLGVGYATLQKCAEENYTCTEHDGRFFKLTNKNSHWDWWVVGGRWTGLLVPHYEPEIDPRNKETCILCGGSGKRTDAIAREKYPDLLEKCNGCDGKGKATKWPTQWADVAGDQMKVDDIPFIALRDEAERKALTRYDKAIEIIARRSFLTWAECREKHGDTYIDAARTEYNNQDVVKDLQQHRDVFDFYSNMDEFRRSREQVATEARASAVCPFAYVKDGQWHERGEMGWWGCVSNEQDKMTWAEGFAKMVDKLPRDSYITCLDCHI